MANFLAEVDEALKQEKAAKLWNEYGGFIFGLALLIIVGTAVMSGYRYWNKGVNSDQSEKFIAALEEKDHAAALSEIAKDLRPGLKTLALWEAAGSFVEKNQNDKAAEIYTRISSDASAPVDFRLLAAYQLARLTAESDPQKGLPMLEKVANNEANPWNDLARFEVAVLQVEYNKNYKVAREHLATLLKRESLPQSLERKVRSLDMLYSLQSTGNETEINPAGGNEEQGSGKK